MSKKILMFVMIFVLMSSLVAAGNVEEIQQTIQNSLSKNGFLLKLVPESEICVLVHKDDMIHSFDIDKSKKILTVSYNSNLFCDGLENEDFVVNFLDYNYFQGLANHVKNFNFKSIPSLVLYLATGARYDQFQILPSKFLEKGGRMNTNKEFSEKYSGLFSFSLRYAKNTKNVVDKKEPVPKEREPVVEVPEEEEISEPEIVVVIEESFEETSETVIVEEISEVEEPVKETVKTVKEKNEAPQKPRSFTLNGRSSRFVNLEELGLSK